MPSRSNRSQRRTPRFRSASVLLRSFGVICSASFVLAGCAPAPQPAPEPTHNDVVDEVTIPVLLPDAGASENQPFFEYVLQQFSETEQAVQGVPLVDALAAAGFQKSAMQVSFDQSRTGLVADSLLVSVQIGEECLIGQVVTADRSVTTTVAPALTDARNICLIGNTRPIDW